MCDIQIFTGITVLISGFVQLPKGIQTYHWQLIVYVAWFSSTTHISAMTSMRSFLCTRHLEKSVRFGLMICLLVMLIIALIPTMFFDWANTFWPSYCSAALTSSPTICFFDIANGKKLSTHSELEWCRDLGIGTPYNPAGQAMVLSLVLLLFGFLSRSVKLFQPLSKAIHVYFRQPVSKFAQRVLVCLLVSRKTATSSSPMTRHTTSGTKVYMKVFRQPCVAVFLSFRITADLMGSMLAEVKFNIIVFFYFNTY